MRRRTFLATAGGGLVALIGAGITTWSHVPVIPKRPEPNLDAAFGWISHREGLFVLTLPRAEMGQNVATAFKQIACAELGVEWEAVQLALHDTSLSPVKATVGSESVAEFSEPLAQACASLRDALEAGRLEGHVEVTPRPVSTLRALQRGGLIGASPELAQGRDIVTGSALYAADVARPGLLHGRVLRAPVSPEVGSRATGWDRIAAETIPGFVAIVEDCGHPNGLAEGLGIVAERPAALDQIAEALAVNWQIDCHPTFSNIAQTIDIDTTLSKGKLGNRVMDDPVDGTSWDINLRLDLSFAPHAQIEPRAAVAEWNDGRLKVWTGTQDAFYVRDELAGHFRLEQDAVTVQSMRIGGAFGGKVLCRAEIEAAALAQAVGAPVKVQWTRAQELAFGFHRPPSSHRLRLRVSESRITDWEHQQVSSHIIFTSAGMPAWMQKATDFVAGDPGVARGMRIPYAVDRAHAAYDMIRLPVHSGPWRGLGAGPNCLAVESAMDEAAIAAGADPLAFRLAHIRDPRLANVLRRVGKTANWPGKAASIKNRIRTGRGIACGIYKENSYAAVVADVAIDPSGYVRVTRLWCVHDCGLVINPDQVRAQCEGNLVWSIGMILSDDLPIETGRVVAENFNDIPIPALSEVPPLHVDLITSDLPPAGAGETVIVAGPGAIANAIRAATGVRPTRFPVQAEEFAA
ncbi:xanthine dehydrogenase family protein molybdopterin-binding subunit [Hoeflea prorocentri]|uniref:Molybdopterin-dependent oxidoreductase n=1 Tax=Hoeflea prorocentri TaxID=1922333 RepID=A0A9X3UFZ1_9HYPH|nr:molybdopterin cofactor-binding domain-containing protein [Hoeflea prorocentri]MCY6380093.1 molybdopterin-dependent oxidoreductase [Hoeflea prorocentri]MDA5397893.1 molybdopterin-dependent oxidoreductase [Hoeflea prorocentri]